MLMLFKNPFSWLSNRRRKDQHASVIAAALDATPLALVSQSVSLPQVTTLAEVVNERSVAPAAIAVVANPPSTNCVELMYRAMEDLYPRLIAQYGEDTDQLVRATKFGFMNSNHERLAHPQA